jgi:hypothetical protein
LLELLLFTGQFIVQLLRLAFLIYLLTITVTLCILAILEVMWSNIILEDWWRHEQFWVVGGTSGHLAAIFQGLLNVIASINISFSLTLKSGAEDESDIYVDLLVPSSLFMPPITTILTSTIAIAVGCSHTICSTIL